MPGWLGPREHGQGGVCVWIGQDWRCRCRAACAAPLQGGWHLASGDFWLNCSVLWVCLGVFSI